MIIRELRIIFIFIFTLLAAFCLAGEAGQVKLIKAHSGRNFTITLEANATTGYQWQFAQPPDTSMLRLISSDYLAAKTKLVGAGGKQVWVFKALQPGETRLFFKYTRPWEKDKPPEEERSFKIVIRG